MQQSLRATVASIRESSHAVLTAAESLNSQAGVVVDSSQTQSDTATSMSASVEEMAVSITQVADYARKVSAHTSEAGRLADNGGREVHAVTEEIGRIIMEGGSAIDIGDAAKRMGVWDLRRSGLEKVRQGMTSLEEINSVTIE